MNKLPVQDAGALGSWGKEPKHQDYLDFIIKWKPVTKFEQPIYFLKDYVITQNQNEISEALSKCYVNLNSTYIPF
jgi:hypothetical protein